MKRFEFTLTGVTPLLLHADSIAWADTMTEWKNKSPDAKNSPAGDDRSPAFRWIGYMAHNGEHVGITADMLTACFRKAASTVTIPGAKRGKTFKTESVALLGFEAELFPIVTPTGPVLWSDCEGMMQEKDFTKHRSFASKRGFELHAIRAQVGTSKHIRVRPKFDRWSVVGRCWVDDEKLATALPDILNTAGRLMGLGDWRPSSPRSPGRYGRFTATIKEVK